MTVHRRFLGLVATVAPLLLSFGCGGSASAPTAPDGSKVTVLLLLNPGIKDNMDENVKADQTTVAARLDKDIADRLGESGYVPRKIASKSEFSPAKDLFLAVTDIDEYQTSDVYSQQDKRLGDGVTKVTVTVELFKDNHTLPVMRRTRGFVCTREWTSCENDLTRSLVKELSERINKSY